MDGSKTTFTEHPTFFEVTLNSLGKAVAVDLSLEKLKNELLNVVSLRHQQALPVHEKVVINGFDAVSSIRVATEDKVLDMDERVRHVSKVVASGNKRRISTSTAILKKLTSKQD